MEAFDVGGIYAPYDYPRSPSVESGEIIEEGEEESHAPPTEFVECGGGTATATPLLPLPAKPEALPTRQASESRCYTAVMLVRRRKMKLRAGYAEWFEFLMERRGDFYQFPQINGKDVFFLFQQLIQKRQVSIRAEDADKYYETSVQAGRTRTQVYAIPLPLTQRLRRDRNLVAPPRLYWLCESQLATHEHIGPPGAFGLPIAPWTLASFYSLHPSLRFATSSPPLVLYHGTDARLSKEIAENGLKPSPGKAAMLGPGVYFARWDKAYDFASHDSGNDLRPEPGIVVRCIVLAGETRVMSSRMRCSCGCGKPSVDHNGEHSRGCRTVFIPDNSLGATRRAEWCVKEPDAIHVDGIFTIASDSSLV